MSLKINAVINKITKKTTKYLVELIPPNGWKIAEHFVKEILFGSW